MLARAGGALIEKLDGPYSISWVDQQSRFMGEVQDMCIHAVMLLVSCSTFLKKS